MLTLRFHTDGGPHTFDGITHHDFPRLLEDVAFDKDNRILVLTGTGDSFIASIDGPSIAVVFRQSISRRLTEGTLAAMALEGLTAANLAYLQQC